MNMQTSWAEFNGKHRNTEKMSETNNILQFLLADSKHITIQEGRLMKPDNHNITILNLRLGDAMVLQCNASNTYGYVYADFYLNVLSM